MRPPIQQWPDDPDAALLRCEGTPRNPGCGKTFHAIAKHESGQRCGRDRCPHCGTRRRIPTELHALYVKWFGLVRQAAKRAGRQGRDYEAAFDLAHDALVTALLRWIPDVSAFSTFAVTTIRHAITRSPSRPLTVTDITGETFRTGEERNAFAVGRCPVDILAAPPDPQRGIDRADVDVALALLPRREARVLRLRYGLNPKGKPRTLAQVGRIMRLTKQGVSLIELKALASLRSILNPSTGV